jgi:predicted amidohydrolase YtcJ
MSENPSARADLILACDTIRTLDSRRPVASAIAVAGDRITAVGDRRDIPAWRGHRTEIIDLGRATLTPGLTDSHMHPVLGLDMTAGLDLSGCKDLTSVRAALRDAVAAAGVAEAGAPGREEWILGWGLDPNSFGTIPVGSGAVEDVLAGRPACLTLFDGHSVLASREALRRAGIDGPRSFGSRSAVVCDEHGRPTGHLLEEGAIRLVRAVIPPESFATRRDRLAALLRDMAAAGLTGGHVMDLDADAVELYAALDHDGQLPLRLRLAPWRRPEDDAATVRELLSWPGQAGRLWSVAAVKLFIDGTIDGGTAWLHEADCHGQSTAAYWRDPRDYTEAVRVLAQAGVQTATHAIGDAAVEHVLDTLASVVPAGSPVRHRIEHIETLPSDQVPRFAELGVVASMQPSHATDYTRADHSDNWSRRLGDERADRAWRCRDLLDAGAILTLGSDWPIAPFDPRGVMAAAQLRRPATRPDLDPVGPSQALTAAQALYGYTTAPALTAGTGHLNGRIAAGYRADLAAFAADPVRTPPEELPGVAVLLTAVDGVIRYRAD